MTKYVVVLELTKFRGAFTRAIECTNDDGSPTLFDSREEAQAVASRLERNIPIHLGVNHTGGGYMVCEEGEVE